MVKKELIENYTTLHCRVIDIWVLLKEIEDRLVTVSSIEDLEKLHKRIADLKKMQEDLEKIFKDFLDELEHIAKILGR